MLSNVRFQDEDKPDTMCLMSYFLVNIENSIGLKNYAIT